MLLPTDFVNCTGLRMCLANGGAPVRWVQNTNAPVDADNTSTSSRWKSNVPLLKDVPLVQDLSAQPRRAATPSIRPSTAVESWKRGLDWHVNDSIAFRGTMSRTSARPTSTTSTSPPAFPRPASRTC